MKPEGESTWAPYLKLIITAASSVMLSGKCFHTHCLSFWLKFPSLLHPQLPRSLTVFIALPFTPVLLKHACVFFFFFNSFILWTLQIVGSHICKLYWIAGGDPTEPMSILPRTSCRGILSASWLGGVHMQPHQNRARWAGRQEGWARLSLGAAQGVTSSW